MLGIASLQHSPVRLHVRGPLGPLIDVAGVVLPVLGRIIKPGHETLFLLHRRDVEETLDQHRVMLDKILFPRIDLVVAHAPH